MDSAPVSGATAEPRDVAALRAAIAEVVGEKGLVCDPQAMAPYLAEARGLYFGRTPFVVRPGSTAEVAAVVRLCAEAGAPVVPQGGNTGLVGGGVPFESGEEILVSLDRMKRIRDIDPVDDTMTVEAGCILQALQQAAESVDRLFPLSLGAEGSCRIGGNISTNAGGIHVLRYGNTRELVLGLEVVLPDGRVWDGLRRLRKDNTGYDLKQLFIGGEGTLGIITAAVLKLFPRPRARATAFAALADLPAVTALLARARTALGEAVSSFELIPRIGLDFAQRHGSGVVDPLAAHHDWYALIEASSATEGAGLDEGLERLLAEAHEAGLVPDAAIAASEAQALAFWRIREVLVEAQKQEGGSIKHDVSVPVSAVPAFIERAVAVAEGLVPGVRPVPFGHVGDGNIHFNLSQPSGADTAAYLARWDEVTRAVHDIVVALEGSISAEHGLGRLKRAEAERVKDPLEIELMRRVKAALDPDNLMNPGKLIVP
ncbi:MAG: FAD-binding oxidoreductase [Kiloniellales bacterium]|nr:FAD-binding oxidoreductase [Kiloniellales bacterium]